MPYETGYNITWDEAQALELGIDVTTIFDEWLHDHDLQGDFMDDGTGGSGSWYDCESDMTELSRRCPQIMFQVHAQGEEPEDIWRLYALGGEVQVARADITFPPCTLGDTAKEPT